MRALRTNYAALQSDYAALQNDNTALEDELERMREVNATDKASLKASELQVGAKFTIAQSSE